MLLPSLGGRICMNTIEARDFPIGSTILHELFCQNSRKATFDSMHLSLERAHSV